MKKYNKKSDRTFEVLLSATIFDPKSKKIIRRYPPIRPHSFLTQYAKLLYGQFNAIDQPIMTPAGTTSTPNNGQLSMRLNAPVNDTSYGIVIGSSDQEVSIDDYKLITQLTTNIQHSATSVNLEAIDANTWQIHATRSFTNNTGTTISIKEVGLYTYTQYGSKHAIDRTLFSKSVAAGKGITLTYTFEVKV